MLSGVSCCEIFESSTDGKFKNSRNSLCKVDQLQLQLPGSECFLVINFQYQKNPKDEDDQETSAPNICGGILLSMPTSKRPYDSAPAKLVRPSMGGEHSLVSLWRKTNNFTYNWRTLKMTCITDVLPSYTMCLRVPAKMEELLLKFHEKGCRLDIDLSTSSQLRTLSLYGAFHVYLGSTILTKVVKLDLLGCIHAGRVFTSMTPGFLFAVLQSTPNVEMLSAVLASNLNTNQSKYPNVYLPRVEYLSLDFGSCGTPDVAAILGSLLLGPSLKYAHFSIDIPPPFIGQLGITSFIKQADATLEELGIELNQKHPECYIPEITNCLRLCPNLNSLTLLANVVTSGFLSAFTLNGNQETDLCPLLSEITLLGDLSCSHKLILDMLSSRRDSIAKIICSGLHRSSLIEVFGPEFRFLDYDTKHIEVTIPTEDEETPLNDEARHHRRGGKVVEH